MSFQLLLEDWQGSSIPDGGGKIIPPARNGEQECSGEWFWASLWWYHEASLTSRSQTSGSGSVIVSGSRRVLSPWLFYMQASVFTGEPQWPIDVLWIPPLPRPPWKTDQWDRIQTSEVEFQWREGGQEDLMIDSVKSGSSRSSRIRTDDLESAFAVRRVSVTESSAVSVEWPLLKPDCLASSLLFCERNNETWLKTTRSSVLAMNGRGETGL